MNTHEKKNTLQSIEFSKARIATMDMLCLFFAASVFIQIALVGITSAADVTNKKDTLTIIYPRSDALFPGTLFAPTLRWEDTSGADKWHISVRFKGTKDTMEAEVRETNWRPLSEQWRKSKSFRSKVRP